MTDWADQPISVGTFLRAEVQKVHAWIIGRTASLAWYWVAAIVVGPNLWLSSGGQSQGNGRQGNEAQNPEVL